MRSILHSDLNNFYASVECMRHPHIKNKPVIVVGSKADRHGVVLAKNAVAKGYGIKTGDTYFEARQKCAEELMELPADFAEYLKVSEADRKIYEEYTDRVEAYGIDECWLDVTASVKLFGSGAEIANIIRERIKKEIGLTVSVGVSWNKIFAKLASDMKKPDAVTEITPENFRKKVWSLPVEELLYVNTATKRKLNKIGIISIGDLATTDEGALVGLLGKWGSYLYKFANGDDDSPVTNVGCIDAVKSVGNSLTVYRNLVNDDDVESVIWLLADSISARLRESGLAKARTVHVYARDCNLIGVHKQRKMPRPSKCAGDIARAATEIFKEIYDWSAPVRSLGVSVSDFLLFNEQTDFFEDIEREERQTRLDTAIDKLRQKYDNSVIQTSVVFRDPKLKDLDIKSGHTIHPYSFFKNV